jgi:hypothetical protein
MQLKARNLEVLSLKKLLKAASQNQSAVGIQDLNHKHCGQECEDVKAQCVKLQAKQHELQKDNKNLTFEVGI